MEQGAVNAHGEHIRPPAPPDMIEVLRRAARLGRPARPVVVHDRAATAHGEYIRPPAPPDSQEVLRRAARLGRPAPPDTLEVLRRVYRTRPARPVVVEDAGGEVNRVVDHREDVRRPASPDTI